MKAIGSLLLLLGLFACEQDEDTIKLSEGDYLIFGHFYGECLGEQCSETFRLEEDRLLESNDGWYTNPRNFVELSQAEFELARGLVEVIPPQLLDQPDSTFGCPDCYDQGGLFIEYNFDGKQREWGIDQTQADVPEYLHAFMDQVNQTITALNP